MPAGSHRRVKIPFYNATWGTCRWCGEPIKKENGTPDKRRRWHQKGWERDCLDEYLTASDHKWVLQKLIERGHGYCVICGPTGPDLPAGIYPFAGQPRAALHPSHLGIFGWSLTHDTDPWTTIGQRLAEIVGERRGWGYAPPWKRPFIPYLEVDHVIPLIDGGTFGMDNLQLLCRGCHSAKTAREARERATQRKDRRQRMYEQLSL